MNVTCGLAEAADDEIPAVSVMVGELRRNADRDRKIYLAAHTNGTG